MSSNIQSFTFSSINLKINKKTILSDLHGKIRSNKMTAIMGLSGAGKSSFLKILSGRFTKKHNGNININDIALTKDTLRKISGYVHQHDILPNYLTVGEYLNFNNKLRTRNSECPGIEALNLNNILDKKIGDTESGGISGGERKRVSIALETSTNPDILFLDEPLSGLDMQNALNITQLLKNTGKTIVATIHQPPSKILDLFDDIIIINNSHIVYHNTYDNFIPYFQILGYTFPKYTNPTEILFTDILPRLESKDCIFDPSKLSDKFNEYKENRDIHENNIDTNQHIPELVNKEKIFEITEHPDSNKINDKGIIKTNKEYINSNDFSTTTNVSENNKYKSLIIKNKKSTEIGMLLLRFFYSTIRNKNILLSRFLQCIGIVFIIGSIFYNIPGLNANSEIITKNGFLYFLVMYVYFGAAMGCVHLFFIDLKLLRREYSNNYYSIISYFISRLITDTILNSVFVIITALSLFLISRAYRTGWVLTVQLFNMWSLSMVGYAWGIFVSSICMDLSSALVILPCVLLPLTIVSGLFLVPSGMVIFLRWIQYISPSRYSYNIAMKTEYGDKIANAVPGDTFTGFFGISISFLILFAMYLVLMGLSFLGLRMKVRKYV